MGPGEIEDTQWYWGTTTQQDDNNEVITGDGGPYTGAGGFQW